MGDTIQDTQSGKFTTKINDAKQSPSLGRRDRKLHQFQATQSTQQQDVEGDEGELSQKTFTIFSVCLHDIHN